MNPLHRILQTLLYLALVTGGITLGTFSLFALAPGDPAEIILRERHETPGPEQIEYLRRELGLDAPWGIRYVRWVRQVAGGDWGVSWRSGLPVWTEIGARLPATLELALAAFALVMLLSLLCGGMAVLWPQRLPDRLIQAVTILFSALPAYFLGLLLIYGLAFTLNLFPVTGRGGWRHLVLPAVTLALSVAVLQGRVLRTTLLQIAAMDYIRFARAKGLSGWQIAIRHVLPNALPPLLTLWGMALGQLLGGAVIVETVFAWPGLGRLTVEAVISRDIPLVQALVLLLALVFVTLHLLVDRLHRWLDPRAGQAA